MIIHISSHMRTQKIDLNFLLFWKVGCFWMIYSRIRLLFYQVCIWNWVTLRHNDKLDIPIRLNPSSWIQDIFQMWPQTFCFKIVGFIIYFSDSLAWKKSLDLSHFFSANGEAREFLHLTFLLLLLLPAFLQNVLK